MKLAKKKESRPVFKAKKMLLSDKSPFSMQEAYKTLRTNLIFSLPGTGCRCIGITSANRGDGKSTIATNLAISLAQINKRVTLVDCDLRLPTVAQKLSIKATPGLSNYLSGDVSRIPLYKVTERGIFVIPAGIIPPDSSTLISSDEMKGLISTLKENCDYVIFDLPPINIVSDAALLASVLDGYLMVVRHRDSEYHMVEEAVRQLRFVNAKILGFVYNGSGDQEHYYRNGKYGYYGY